MSSWLIFDVRQMKEIAQTLLILGGGLGLFAAAPAAIYGWTLHRGFSGESTGNDLLLLYSPLICIAAITLGIAWRRFERKAVPKGQRKLTGDTGSSGEVGGLE